MARLVTRLKTRVLQLKIELQDTEPPVWRRFLVKDSILLIELHQTIQTVMGWWDSHLHSFEIEGKQYSWPDPDGHLDFIDVETTVFRKVLKPKTQTFLYEYDFGDCWQHTVTIEKDLGAEEDVWGIVPQCLDGANACPPEDAGGTSGFKQFKESITENGSKEQREMADWCGSLFQPTSFCPNLVNRELRHLLIFDWREKPRLRKGTMLLADPYPEE